MKNKTHIIGTAQWFFAHATIFCCVVFAGIVVVDYVMDRERKYHSNRDKIEKVQAELDALIAEQKKIKDTQ